jgi:uncharacterized protein YbaR (Trm112 family)
MMPRIFEHNNSLYREEYMMNRDLLEILACPKCKGPVKLEEQKGLVCEKCMLLYEIRDDIPIMLIDEAKKIPQ